MTASTHYFAGLDIGGTTIKAVLIGSSGDRIGEMEEVRSMVDYGFRRTFSQLEEALRRVCRQGGIEMKQLSGIGLDVPSPCCDGVVWGKANLAADWVGRNIRDGFSERLQRPVFMTNDGSAAAYGEYVLRDRNGKGLLYVAPGTGLAGGLILPSGHIYEGANGLAMEIGHISVPFREKGKLPMCTCGRPGCVEAWVSLMAIRRQLEAKLATKQYAAHPLNQEDTTIAERAFRLRDFADRGDQLALEIFEKQARILGYALADQASELDPGLVVIGGGLAETGFRDLYLEKLVEGFEERASPFYQRNPLIPEEKTTHFEWAIGGDSAAAFGVARKAMERAPE